MSKKITKRNYKNKLSKIEIDELYDDLYYQFHQNLKIPFLEFIKKPRQLTYISLTALITYLFQEDSTENFLTIIEIIKYSLITTAILYFFTNEKYEDILENNSSKK